MNIASLLGQTIQNIQIFRGGVHPAWIDKNTLPIAAWGAFLDVLESGMLKITACEVDIGPKRYPALGLEIQPCSAADLKYQTADGQSVEAEVLAEVRSLLPFKIARVEQSDPLGEDTVTQYALIGSEGRRLIFQHMMPPTTLGIAVLPPVVTVGHSDA
jgi:hypothetical protein